MDGAARQSSGAPDSTPAPRVDARRYREVVGRFPTGVTVVTVCLDGEHHGMTANTFTSVSLDPVLVLVCIERSARLHDLLLAAGTWGVSVLATDQEWISRLFAERGRPAGASIAAVAYRVGELSGAALLQAAVATFECRTVAVHEGGDHAVVIGAVLDLGTPRDAPPLVYYRGAYGTVLDPDRRPGLPGEDAADD